jgi:putative endonuclease
MKTTAKGRLGENRALKYLEEQGQHLVRRNYHCRRGEIDLITEEERRLHFVEVKHWKISMENLEYSIDSHKQRKIVISARDFLVHNGSYSDYEKQFDIVYINDEQAVVRYIPGAFEGGD